LPGVCEFSRAPLADRRRAQAMGLRSHIVLPFFVDLSSSLCYAVMSWSSTSWGKRGGSACHIKADLNR
jgi:hypothetical protein